VHQGAGPRRVAGRERPAIGGEHGDTPAALGLKQIIGYGVARHDAPIRKADRVAVSRRTSAQSAGVVPLGKVRLVQRLVASGRCRSDQTELIP